MRQARTGGLAVSVLIAIVVGGCVPPSDRETAPSSVSSPAALSPVVSVSPGAEASSAQGQSSAGPTSTSAPGPSPTLADRSPGAIAPQPLPTDLRPSLGGARGNVPLIYRDGCHLDFLATLPASCVFGDPASRIVVVLFGDSKAGQWFPALQRLATTRRWRLVSLTKSACSAAKLMLWNASLKRPYAECDRWRNNVLTRIRAEHPTLVVVSEDRSYELAIGNAPTPVGLRPEIWRNGLASTLVSLRGVSSSVMLIGDTPGSRVDVPACLAAHRANTLACATPTSLAINYAWLAADRATAKAAGARFIDPSPWVCPSDPCPAVIGNLLVYRDRDHLTADFAAGLAKRLGAVLPVP